MTDVALTHSCTVPKVLRAASHTAWYQNLGKSFDARVLAAGALNAPRRVYVALGHHSHLSVTSGQVRPTVKIPISAITSAHYPKDGMTYVVPTKSTSNIPFSPARPFIHV